MARRRSPAPLPTKEQILEFIAERGPRTGAREIARAFQISGAERRTLKAMLRELAAEGLIEQRSARGRPGPGGLPEVTVLEIAEADVDGELLARPLSWRGEHPPPRIVMAPERGRAAALAEGDRVLARLTLVEAGLYQARTIRRLPAAPDRVLGIYTTIAGSGRIVPTEKRRRQEYVVAAGDQGGAERGELVSAEVLAARHLGLRKARVVERLGTVGSPRSLSLIAIHAHGIPTEFSAEALAEAEAAAPVGLGGRADLRALALVTIDPADARDHDDAVWAEPDRGAGNPGGWHLVVAIADVAHYVPPGGALDGAAAERGNSVYFPDRVVPMLPHELSSGLCSLRPGEERPVLAAHLWIDGDGKRLRHAFERGLMRSKAALSYRQLQAAADGEADAVTGPLVETVIAPLYGAYEALRRARERRQPLDIDVPERRVTFDAEGRVTAVEPRSRLISHRLIEEFMIAANQAAAETLAGGRTPCMYRVHEPPSEEKLRALRDFLDSLDLGLARAATVTPAHFNRVIASVAGSPHDRLVNEVILRAQSKACYSAKHAGHFGLALKRYAHFTSPIRRYADLLVHRALISALGLGRGGLPKDAAATLAETAEHISDTERRADAAERDALDRFTAAFLAERVGATLAGHISGVSRFGLFVTLEESGADGLIPIRTLGEEYFEHDEARHALVGRSSGTLYRLGDQVEVRLVEADPISGAVRLELLVDRGREPTRPRAGRGRPARRRARRR
ncbi:MAG: ribonuclease R [Alphaproteobacteria bacterium]